MPTIDERIDAKLRAFRHQLITEWQGQFTPSAHDILDHSGFPGGTSLFLRADDSFATPPGGGTPSSTVAALDGTGAAGSSTDYSRGDHKHADANRPTDDEKDALAGTGTPSAGNPYVNSDDSRLGIGGASGALVLLESHAASSSASLDFTTRNKSGLTGATIQSDFDRYLVEFVNLIPATDSVDLWMRMSTDGGSTYDSGNNYFLGGTNFNNTGGGAQGQSISAKISKFAFQNTGNISNTALYGVIGNVQLFAPGSANNKLIKFDLSYLAAGTVMHTLIGSAAYVNGTAVDAFQFLFSSGNISSGTIRVYGVAK